MRDYEGLVKRLREAKKHIWTQPQIELYPMMYDAADAIEEMCKQRDKALDRLCEWCGVCSAERRDALGCDDIAQLDRPRWISVEERLPESGTHVLACCREKWLGGGGRSYVCDAFHSDSKTIPCSYNDDIDMEYDEETDEYYFPEGWWEVIKNWDEYSCVAIADFVTHWMPLPEPPKEGLK